LKIFFLPLFDKDPKLYANSKIIPGLWIVKIIVKEPQLKDVYGFTSNSQNIEIYERIGCND